jgi:hypothetical protein
MERMSHGDVRENHFQLATAGMGMMPKVVHDGRTSAVGPSHLRRIVITVARRSTTMKRHHAAVHFLEVWYGAKDPAGDRPDNRVSSEAEGRDPCVRTSQWPLRAAIPGTEQGGP